MGLVSLKACRALVLAGISAVLVLPSLGQAAAAGSRLPGPSRADLYGGYAYFHPMNSGIYGYTYQPINPGAIVSASGYFTPLLGVQVQGTFSPHGPNDCAYTAQAGPVVRYQYGRLVPFAHFLAGGAKIGGPVVQPCTWGFGLTTGLGLDYVLPTQILRNRIAVRPIEADLEYSDVNYGPNTVPLNINGGVGKVLAYRLSGGVVYRLGEILPPIPASYSCEIDHVSAYSGDPITVTGKTLNLEVGKKLKPVYTWKTAGGVITGTTETATIATAGLAPGDYTVTGHVSEGVKTTEHADCTASFRIIAYEPPTIACSANPASILTGGFSTITIEARSPQNRPLDYSYASTAGQITGTTATGTLATADVSPGVVTVTCNVVDDLGKSASATTTVTVTAPVAPPAPLARNLCSLSFERDRRRPVRVDNEAKGCLDDIALALNRESDATLVIIGKHDPKETPDAAAQRALNVKEYLVVEKGIDPVRIQMRTGETTGRNVDDVLVPAGATWDAGSTTTFDPGSVKREGQPYGRR